MHEVCPPFTDNAESPQASEWTPKPELNAWVMLPIKAGHRPHDLLAHPKNRLDILLGSLLRGCYF